MSSRYVQKIICFYICIKLPACIFANICTWTHQTPKPYSKLAGSLYYPSPLPRPRCFNKLSVFFNTSSAYVGCIQSELCPSPPGLLATHFWINSGVILYATGREAFKNSLYLPSLFVLLVAAEFTNSYSSDDRDGHQHRSWLCKTQGISSSSA